VGGYAPNYVLTPDLLYYRY